MRIEGTLPPDPESKFMEAPVTQNAPGTAGENRDVMIRFDGVEKSFPQGKRTVVALNGLDLDIEKGSFVSIMGPSGSGKSTLLHLAGGMDLPTAGLVKVSGQATSRMTDLELTLFRRRKIGFVFQFFNLMPTLTVEENVALPLLLEGTPLSAIRAKVRGLLGEVGLEHRVDHTPEELSGGEMQRAAIARALVTDPPLLLADEPTGNLDSATGREILGILKSIHESEPSRTLMMVTHDPAAAAYADRQITIRDGKVAR